MKFGYARVSTPDQNLDLQLDALAAAGVDPRNIESEKLSGKSLKRPVLDRLIKKLRAGDVLVIWKFDRIGRDMPHLVSLITELTKAGVDVQSLTEGLTFETRTPMGKLMVSIFAWIAEFELDRQRERITAGLEAAKARGKTFGRRRKVSNEAADNAIYWLDQGESMAKVARMFALPRKTLADTVQRRRAALAAKEAAQ